MQVHCAGKLTEKNAGKNVRSQTRPAWNPSKNASPCHNESIIHTLYTYLRGEGGGTTLTESVKYHTRNNSRATRSTFKQRFQDCSFIQCVRDNWIYFRPLVAHGHCHIESALHPLHTSSFKQIFNSMSPASSPSIAIIWSFECYHVFCINRQFDA